MISSDLNHVTMEAVWRLMRKQIFDNPYQILNIILKNNACSVNNGEVYIPSPDWLVGNDINDETGEVVSFKEVTCPECLIIMDEAILKRQ